VLRVVQEAARTDTGLQRHANEDSYLARAPVFVVADGMGGAQAGEVASKIAADAFDASLEGEAPEQELAERAREANRRIFQRSREDASRAGMGTTLTAAVLAGEEVSIAHVGDSRAYLFRDGELRQLTRDHSLVEELRRQGRLTSEEAEEHPQRSIITRALGPEPDVDPDVHSHQARPGDVFLLCSDGLTSMVRDGELREILASSNTLREAVDGLVAEANRAGGRDNITVVCFEVGGELEGKPEALAEDPDEIDKTITNMNVRDLETATPAPAAPARAARPPRASRRWPRRAIAAAAVVILLGGLAVGASIGLRHVYFIGQDDHGLVALYQGVPYELPGGMKLYEDDYVSSIPVNSLSAVERQRLLDHQLRSRDDAAGVVRSLERGERGK